VTENRHSGRDVDLSELVQVLWSGKWWLAGITLAGAALSVLLALSLPNIYRSEILLSPVDSSLQSSQLGQLGGVAALAGINLNSSGNKKATLALEVLQSREFVSNFIEQHNLFVPLFAVESWNIHDNSFNYKTGDYDVETGTWLREADPPRQAKPSLQEAYKEFMLGMEIQERKANGTIVVAIEHYSPYLAQRWVTDLVTELDYKMKALDMAEATRSLQYLEQQLQKTSVEELRRALYQLIEEQTKTLMLAEVSDQYVFKIIDPAIVSEIQHKPRRALLCIVITLFSALLAGFIVLVRYFSKRSA
tara:strand:- start:5916 stop:6830 length:915 start_codon:yes stop_codon:yes gene_type:complete